MNAMDTTAVFTKVYSADMLPPIDRREVLRYMGGRPATGAAANGKTGAAGAAANGKTGAAGAPSAGAGMAEDALSAVISECEAEALPLLSYKVCYRRCALSFVPAGSRDLARNLSGCEAVLVFAATVGMGIDRLITKYGRLSPVKALCFQAIGAERIECLCDFFCGEVRKTSAENGLLTRPRFSPGYGDLPLSFQRDVFSVLDCWRKIGLSLNDSLLMSPSKSVTAVIGLYREDAVGDREADDLANGDYAAGPAVPCERPETGNAGHSRCDSCEKKDCLYRR